MEYSRRCDICNFDVHRASMSKSFRSKNHLEKKGQDDIVIPKGLFREGQEPNKNESKNYKILSF